MPTVRWYPVIIYVSFLLSLFIYAAGAGKLGKHGRKITVIGRPPSMPRTYSWVTQNAQLFFFILLHSDYTFCLGLSRLCTSFCQKGGRVLAVHVCLHKQGRWWSSDSFFKLSGQEEMTVPSILAYKEDVLFVLATYLSLWLIFLFMHIWVLRCIKGKWGSIYPLLSNSSFSMTYVMIHFSHWLFLFVCAAGEGRVIKVRDDQSISLSDSFFYLCLKVPPLARPRSRVDQQICVASTRPQAFCTATSSSSSTTTVRGLVAPLRYGSPSVRASGAANLCSRVDSR